MGQNGPGPNCPRLASLVGCVLTLQLGAFSVTLETLKGTKIVTSHDLDLIYDTCDRTILIADGKIIFDGDTKTILQNKDLLENNGLELPLSLQRR